MKGFLLSENQFVETCQESLFIDFNFFPCQNFMIDFEEKKVIFNEFVFGKFYLGVIHDDVMEELQMPLVVCLVKGQDFS